MVSRKLRFPTSVIVTEVSKIIFMNVSILQDYGRSALSSEAFCAIICEVQSAKRILK